MAVPSSGIPGLLQRLDQFAATQPDKTLYTYLNDDGKPIASFTYKELAAKSALLGQNILAKAGEGKLKAGDRILLVFLPSLDFILAFVACLRVGLVPVPVYPPDPRRTKAYITAFAQIAADCGATVALSHGDYLRAIQLSALAENAKKLFSFRLPKGGAKANDWPDLLWLNSSELSSSSSSFYVSSAAAASSSLSVPLASLEQDANPAFLQYTSGSTADPKGVIITHGSLKHNLSTIVRSLDADRGDTIVASWLPQYHDMGLIGSLLGVLYCGGSGFYISPLSFIKRPSLWLEMMSRYRATHIQSPNFGYKLAARKWREAHPVSSSASASMSSMLDLSSLRHMFNAAEPITSDAIADFFATFSPYGLKKEAMKPGYGLAEHTVYVSDGGLTALKIDKEQLEHDNVRVFTEVSLFGDSGSSTGGVSSSSSGGGGGELAKLHDALDLPVAATAGPSDVSVHLPGSVVISCGPVAPFSPSKNPDIVVLVVHRDTQVPIGQGEAKVGEVWLCSPSCAAGYWAGATRQEAVAAINAEIFQAQIKSPPSAMAMATATATAAAAAAAIPTEAATTGEAPDILSAQQLYERYAGHRFLRTGDLGFIHRGELYICGRAKDLIIVRGRNHYPQDVEATTEGVSLSLSPDGTSNNNSSANGPLRPGTSAAFQAPVITTSPPEEGIVVVAEVRDASMPQQELVALRDAIRTAIAREHGEGLSALLLLKPHAARKTTSGKIARKWNKKAFLEMHADSSSPWHPSQGNVLLEWRISESEALAAAAAATTPAVAAAGAGAEEASVAAADAAPSQGEAALYQNTGGLGLDGAAAVSSAAVPAAAPAPAPALAPPSASAPLGTPPNIGVVGQALAEALAAQIARLLRADPSSIRSEVALVDTGLDSMAMVQLGPVFRDSYGLFIRDEHLFNTGLTLEWILANTEALRRPYLSGLPPNNPDGSLNAEAVAAVPVPPHDQERQHQPQPQQPPAAVGAAVNGDESPVATAMTGPVPVGGVPMATLPPRRHQPSWFERNFPCCAWCF